MRERNESYLRRFPLSYGGPVVRQVSYWSSQAESVIAYGHHQKRYIPIRFVEYYNLMPPRRKGNFFLRECLDFVPHDVDTSRQGCHYLMLPERVSRDRPLIRCIQLQDALFVRISK